MTNTCSTKPTQRLIIVMGVSGSGKSTIAEYIANHYHLPYIDADDFHSAKAKTLMKQGIPLTDTVREPWIQRLCDHLQTIKQQGEDCVMAYSGLRKKHRQRFRLLGFKTQFLWLHGELNTISDRLQKRQGHFFDPKLLRSQFDTLDNPEEETDVITIDITPPSIILQQQVLSALQ